MRLKLVVNTVSRTRHSNCGVDTGSRTGHSNQLKLGQHAAAMEKVENTLRAAQCQLVKEGGGLLCWLPRRIKLYNDRHP